VLKSTAVSWLFSDFNRAQYRAALSGAAPLLLPALGRVGLVLLFAALVLSPLLLLEHAVSETASNAADAKVRSLAIFTFPSPVTPAPPSAVEPSTAPEPSHTHVGASGEPNRTTRTESKANDGRRPRAGIE
jgi:hypothetical protein